MGRNNSRERPTKRIIRDTGKRIKKKPCALCVDRIDYISYRDVAFLRKFMSDRGKIRARRVSGNCEQHQREVSQVIKTARELALLPYLQRTVSERISGRGGSGRGPGGGSHEAALESVLGPEEDETDEAGGEPGETAVEVASAAGEEA